MSISRMTFLILILTLNNLIAEENKLEIAAKKSIQILAALKFQGDEYTFQCVGVDALGRIMMLRRASSNAKNNEIIEINKLGFEFTSYTNVKIVSKETGELEFLFQESTAGSSLTAIGKDGNVKNIFSIPKGVFPDSDGKGYFANLTIKIPEELPIKENEKKWVSYNAALLLGGELSQDK